MVEAEYRRILEAVAAGRVVRDDCNGTRAGMWALRMLDGDDVSMAVRYLSRLGLVRNPLLGPPVITEDGLKLLRAG